MWLGEVGYAEKKLLGPCSQRAKVVHKQPVCPHGVPGTLQIAWRAEVPLHPSWAPTLRQWWAWSSALLFLFLAASSKLMRRQPCAEAPRLREGPLLGSSEVQQRLGQRLTQALFLSLTPSSVVSQRGQRRALLSPTLQSP